MLCAQPLQPIAIAGRWLGGSGVQQGLQRQRRVTQHAQRALAVVAQLSSAVGNPQKLCVAKNSGRAIGQLEVQTPSYGHYQIGLAHDRAAHRADQAGVRFADQAPAFAGIQVGGVEAREQGAQRGARTACAAPGDKQRPFSGP